MGADYKRARPAEFSFQSGVNLNAGQTRYMGNDLLGAGVAGSRMIMTRPVTIDRIYADLSAVAGAGESVVFTLMVNGIASAITVTIAGAVLTAGNSFANAIALVPGDYLVIRVVASGACAAVTCAAAIGGSY